MVGADVLTTLPSTLNLSIARSAAVMAFGNGGGGAVRDPSCSPLDRVMKGMILEDSASRSVDMVGRMLASLMNITVSSCMHRYSEAYKLYRGSEYIFFC